MNVLIVHPCKGFYGGAEEVVVQLANYLVRNDHQILVILKDAPNELCNKLPVGHPHCGARTTRSWKAFRREVRKELDWADVANVHNFPATLATLPTRKPIVWMCNEPPELFTNWRRKPVESINRAWVKKSRMKVVVADQFNSDRFESLYNVQPRIIPYGVNYDFWSRGVRIPSKSGKVRLLQVGTVTPYKNQLQSIQVLMRLLSYGIDATLTLAGGIVDPGYHLECLKIPYSKERVKFLGLRSPEEVRDLYNTHDVLLHPVRGQGGWLVPFEAMCARLPVVTIPAFSASDMIRDNGLGQVSYGLSGGVQRVLWSCHTSELECIKLWVKENLTWERFGESMLDAFKEVTGAK